MQQSSIPPPPFVYILGRVTGGLESWPGEGIVKRCFGQQLRDRAKNVARCQGYMYVES